MVNGTTLNGSNTVDLLKWATVNHDPKGKEPDGLEDFFSILHDLSLPTSLLPNATRHRISAMSRSRKMCFGRGGKGAVWKSFYQSTLYIGSEY